MSRFGEMLRKLRKEANLTQEALAKRLGVRTSTIGMYEQGRRKPSFEVLEAVADEFNVDLDTLMDRASNPSGSRPALSQWAARARDAVSELSEKDQANAIKMLETYIETIQGNRNQ